MRSRPPPDFCHPGALTAQCWHQLWPQGICIIPWNAGKVLSPDQLEAAPGHRLCQAGRPFPLCRRGFPLERWRAINFLEARRAAAAISLTHATGPLDSILKALQALTFLGNNIKLQLHAKTHACHFLSDIYTVLARCSLFRQWT